MPSQSLESVAVVPWSVAALAVAAAALAPAAPAWAQKKVPGELYRQTMSMEMQGMTMPGQTSEICLPKGREAEAASQPPDSNCRMYDMRQSGNKFSARMECTGEDAMRGSIEQITEGNRIRGTMMAERDGQKMTMRFDSVRLGKACEATDWSDYKPPAAPTVGQADVCGQAGKEIATRSRLAESAMYYVGPGAPCKSPAQLKPWCAAVETPSGFLSLKDLERTLTQQYGAAEMDDIGRPLGDSVAACGFGKGPAAIEKLRLRLLAVARTQSNWEYLLREGDAAVFAELQETAKKECSGRNFTTPSSARFANLCQSYGAALVRGDQAAAQQIAANRVGAPTSAAAPAGDAGAGTQAVVPAEPPQSPTQDLMKKGRGVLRGIFGGP